MAIVTTLTFNSTAYDVSNYVMRHSIEIDEQLFNPDNLKPTTNRCDFKLSRSCPYIDELFAWTGDVEVSVVADGVAAFAGYLTDNYGLKITARGASDVSLSAEDPGIKKLKTAWVSTGALVTVFAGEKVCDPADTANSFVHILAGLAGVTLATTLPTISDTVYFSVQDKDKKQYWDILEKVLLDYRHVFYFDATGKLALFALDGLTGTASQYVCTNGTILQKSPGDPGVEIKKRLIQYKEVIVNFDEGETLASATVFRDTTGQGLTDCEIEIAAGAYYPTSCNASTYAYIDYFLEDGREIKAVDSISADFSLDSGITYELTNLGTSAQIRFYNPTALTRSIRKLKITGTNVLAVKADSKVTSTIAGGKKLEYDANYITELADAQSLANLLRYYYANSGSLYTFRAYAGTLYPSDTLFPSDTLYPLGDTILLGDITRLHDPVWTGLDVNCGIYRKKYTVGKAGATFDAVGIGTITLSDAVSIYPIYQPNVQSPSSLPEIQAIADAAQAAAQAYADGLADTIQTQIDRAIVYFTQAGDPSSAWTADEKKEHTGDYWRTATGAVWYQWSGAAWVEISDPVAQQAADDAQTTADDKITVWADLATAQANALANDLFLASGLLYRCLSDAATTYERITPKRWPDGTTLPTAVTHEPLLTNDTFYKTDTHQWYYYTTSWVTDGEPQLIDDDVITLIPTYTPHNLGRYEAAHPTTHNPGDWWTVYDTDDDPVERGIYYDNAGTVTRISAVSGETGYTTTGALLAKLSSCMADVAWCEANSYGTAANYGITMFFESFGAVMAFIQTLFAQNIVLGATGYLQSNNYAETGGYATAGVKIDAATGVVNSKSGKFVSAEIKDATITNATISGKASFSEVVISNITAGTNVIKTSSTVFSGANGSYTEVIRFQICASGSIRIAFRMWAQYAGYTARAAVYINSTLWYERTSVGTAPSQKTDDINVTAGDLIRLCVMSSYLDSSYYNTYVDNFTLSCAEQPGILKYIGTP